MDTLVDLLASFPHHRDKRLVWTPDESLSYAEAYDAALALAGHLRGLGLGRGDEVLITLHNGSAFPIALLGVAAAGCTAILADRESGGQVLAGAGGTTPTARIHDHAGEARLELNGPAGYSSALHQLLKVPARASDLPLPSGADTAAILYTSGSSGAVRGVAKTHANLMVEIADLADILASPGDRFLSVLPWSYIYGLLHHLLLPMYVGGVAYHLRSYTPYDLVETVVRHEIDLFVGVPALYRVISALSLPVRGTGLSWAVSSGAPLEGATAAKIGARLGWPLVEFYGSTESGGISFNPDKLTHGDSVGHPMPHIEVRGLTRGQQPGVLEVRGPTVSEWACEGARRIHLTDGDGWYATNDTGHIDGDGRLHLLGRTGRLIKVAGKRVSLDSIEAALLAIPGVMDAAVSARLDRVHGEVAIADVVPAPGSGLSLERLMGDCQRRLPPHQRPREVRLCDGIQRRRNSKGPITAAGTEALET